MLTHWLASASRNLTNRTLFSNVHSLHLNKLAYYGVPVRHRSEHGNRLIMQYFTFSKKAGYETNSEGAPGLWAPTAMQPHHLPSGFSNEMF